MFMSTDIIIMAVCFLVTINCGELANQIIIYKKHRFSQKIRPQLNPYDVDVHREQRYDPLLNRDNELLRSGKLGMVFDKAFMAHT